jgi:hypothetical protein
LDSSQSGVDDNCRSNHSKTSHHFDMNQPNYFISIPVIGPKGAEKTALCSRWSLKNGSNLYQKLFPLDTDLLNVTIIDYQENLLEEDANVSCFQDACQIIIVFDVTTENGFNDIPTFFQKSRLNTSMNITFLII